MDCAPQDPVDRMRIAQVRDRGCFRASVNVIMDGEGLEVSFQ